jgi:hypothetical protein
MPAPDDINPYQPPSANLIPDRPLLDPQDYPGIRRLAFLASVLLIYFVSLLIASYIRLPWGRFGLFLNIIPVYFRLRNIGAHPFWCILSPVPLITLLVTIPCFVLPSGFRHHRQLDIPAKVFSVLSLLFVLWLFYLIFA